MKLSIILLSVSLLMSSCGGSGGSGGGGKKSAEEDSNPVNIEIDGNLDGQYLAVFEPINHQITGKVTGAFTFSRDKAEDEIVGDVRLNNAGPKLIHAQYVRSGTRCPEAKDDTNADGVIDAKEGEAVYGRILFPLDGDLSSQSSHDGEFPVGNNYGSYIYSKVAKFTTFIKDMRAHSSEDGYVKLKSDEPLQINGRVVVIHGVDQASDLPATVAGVGRMSNYQSLPIVCGVIWKVLGAPGRMDDGTVMSEDQN